MTRFLKTHWIARAKARCVAWVRSAPDDGAHRVALRVALSAVLPVLLLAALHHTEWSTYSLLTSTVAIYGRQRRPVVRLSIQAQVALLQILLIVAGTALAGVPLSPWILVPCTAAIAGVGAALADLRQWNPPGALFFLLVFAISASRLGADSSVLLVAFLVSTGSAVIALAVTLLDGRYPHRSEIDPPLRCRPPLCTIAVNALVCLMASLLAGVSAVALGFSRPYWAMISAVIPMTAPSTITQFRRALQRLAGTVAGLLPAALLFQIRMSPALLLTLQVGLMTCAELFVARNYTLALLFVTPMSIGMALMQSGASLPRLLVERALETTLGVTVAAIGIVLTHLLRHPRSAAAE